ncbi:MAG: hypothetical protein JWR75_985 [Devosia sp.]|nr:hypothetical protein [Devosia sp.]
MRLAAFLFALLAGTSGAMAQDYAGNWACTDGVTRSGLLTLYAGSYGFASKIVGDTASGTGGYESYSDGAALSDGNLRAVLGVEAARIGTADTGGVILRLETNAAVIMVCTPR